MREVIVMIKSGRGAFGLNIVGYSVLMTALGTILSWDIRIYIEITLIYFLTLTSSTTYIILSYVSKKIHLRMSNERRLPIRQKMGSGRAGEEWSIRCKHCYLVYDDFSRFKLHLELCHPELYLANQDLINHVDYMCYGKNS